MSYYLLTTITLIAALLSIGLDAYADARIDEFRKRKHWHEAFSIFFTMVFAIVGYHAYVIGSTGNLLPSIWIGSAKIITAYTLLRVAIFNTIYNSFRGNEINYIGSTDTMFDKYLKKLPVLLQMNIWLVLFAFGGVTGLYLIFTL